MVNRLKVIMPDIVDDYQNAFIPGRFMVDNCFMASELMSYVRRKKKGKQFAAILKVDLSKAYDRVRWDFVESVLVALKFPTTPGRPSFTLSVYSLYESIIKEVKKTSKVEENLSPNTPSLFIRLLKRPLSVKSDTRLGTYLGCPMDVDGRSTSQLSLIHDKLLQKLSSWKFIHLSQAGKIVLINGILVALSANILSLYLIPAGLTKRITSTIMRFWWSSLMDRRPIYWRKKEVWGLEVWEESDDHLFRDCSMSDHIWRSMAMRGNASPGVDISK
ncbi:uncharacterized protein [Spinacia oleracea]|uniref:Reverse transcriptase domain-containing protein n=1 Tax=Spinacia oleracea TaxID=3562 RepID=A0ABM3RIT7_SPIOL|nr:uncharacterized protein LOC130469983 [Spinacia oleracea]XP_056695524.1 uncharacterized protein LOC130469994 [Spinacia oleracea]